MTVSDLLGQLEDLVGAMPHVADLEVEIGSPNLGGRFDVDQLRLDQHARALRVESLELDDAAGSLRSSVTTMAVELYAIADRAAHAKIPA